MRGVPRVGGEMGEVHVYRLRFQGQGASSFASPPVADGCAGLALWAGTVFQGR
jgi:hypothetical protein